MLAKTPPMGWNSRNNFGENISETLIKETADALVTTGMRDAYRKTLWYKSRICTSSCSCS